MAITILSQKLEIDDCKQIVVSAVTADTSSGDYTRTIQFYIDPSSTANRRPVLEVLLYGEEDDLEIVTPALGF